MTTATLESLVEAISNELNRGDYGPVQSLVAYHKMITENEETMRFPADVYIRIGDDSMDCLVPIAVAECFLIALRKLPQECPWEEVWETITQFGTV